MKKIILLSGFIICSVISLTQNFQEEHIVFSGYLPDRNILNCSDINNDGNIDVISASYGYNKALMWLENDGNGNFNFQHIIETGIEGGINLFSTDIDNDGDMDIIASLQSENSVIWFENINNGTFSQRKIISDSVIGANLIISADFDNNGKNDVLTSAQGGHVIYFHKNLGNGNFETNGIITTNTGIIQSIYVTDIDNDNDNDILAGLRDESEICWFENMGNGTFGEQITISTEVDSPGCVIAADFDNDGDNDVVSASFWDGKIAWYENQGSGTFSEQIILTEGGDRMISVFASDLDNDNDLDIISGSNNEQMLSWFENTNNGNFSQKKDISEKGGGSALFSGDFNNDGDNDIVSNNCFFKNTGAGLFNEAKIIFSAPTYSNQVFAYDIDDDLQKDILYVSPSIGAGYFQNTGFDRFKNISIYNPFNPIYALSITLSDINDDGQQDILIGSSGLLFNYYINEQNEIVYKGVIDTIPYFIESLNTADFDGDSDSDILISTMYIDYIWSQQQETRISWLENTNNGESWKEHILDSRVSYYCNFKSIPADINSDGKQDIISTNCLGDSLFFYVNDGNGSFDFAGFKVPGNFLIFYFDFADVDSDNDMDIIATTSNNNKMDYAVIWLENSGSGTFNDYHIIDDNASPYRLLVSDIDKDGDEDIVINASLNSVDFYYNDGTGTFTLSESFESENCYFEHVTGTDMDNDSDIDVLYIGSNNKIAWIENNLLSTISEFSNDKVFIYPNPASDIFHINLQNRVTTELYNIYGELVLSGSKKDVNISSLPNGIYQAIIKNNSKLYYKKIIKM